MRIFIQGERGGDHGGVGEGLREVAEGVAVCGVFLGEQAHVVGQVHELNETCPRFVEAPGARQVIYCPERARGKGAFAPRQTVAATGITVEQWARTQVPFEIGNFCKSPRSDPLFR